MKTFFHPEQLLHHPRSYFSRGKMRVPQEVPERARNILLAVEALKFDLNQPADGGMKPLEAVHTVPYMEFLRTAHTTWKNMPADWGDEVMSTIYVRSPNALRGILAQAGAYLNDGSCPVGEHTWRAAYWSAQSAVAAAQAVLDGERFAYALSRPPGHHARAAGAGGFCYLNNAAIAAEMLRQRYGKVVVLDTDMHHGQGIQEIFWERDDVMYISIHGDPENFYPATAGFADETGAGKGAGLNLNLPMPHGSEESVFFDMMARARAAMDKFQPDAVVLSLGFDIYINDPQSMVKFSAEGFNKLGAEVASYGLPTVVVQEGGYDLASLNDNAQRFFTGMKG